MSAFLPKKRKKEKSPVSNSDLGDLPGKPELSGQLQGVGFLGAVGAGRRPWRASRCCHADVGVRMVLVQPPGETPQVSPILHRQGGALQAHSLAPHWNPGLHPQVWKPWQPSGSPPWEEAVSCPAAAPTRLSQDCSAPGSRRKPPQPAADHRGQACSHVCPDGSGASGPRSVSGKKTIV